MATSSPSKPDGRLLRSERSRESIIDAMNALIDEEIPMPTAERVAERAGVGIRTVFRHFSDMETLFTAMIERFNEQALPFLDVEPPAGNVSVRVRALVARRAKFYKRFAARERSSRLVRWRSPALDNQLKVWIRALRKDTQRWIPEVRALDQTTADAFEATLSFSSYLALRYEHGLSAKRAAAAVERAALALVADR